MFQEVHYMILFDKKKNKLWKYLYISSFCFLMFTFACFLYNYRNLFDEGGQDYYMDGINFQTFKERYTRLYKSINNNSTDYFIFHEPYKGKYKKIEYMGKDYMALKSPSKRGSKDSLDYVISLRCRYYLSSIDGYVTFFVKDGKTIKVKLFDYYPSYSVSDYERWKNCFVVNGRRAPYDKNKEIINAFENEVLNKITPYERDYMQGYIRQYVSFFERYFLYYLAFFIILPIPLVVRFLNRKIGPEKRG